LALTSTDIDATAWPLSRPTFALETSVPGVFSAGDVRANGIKRVAARRGRRCDERADGRWVRRPPDGKVHGVAACGVMEPTMSGIAIITEACIDVKDRACVDVCPVQCIYELDMSKGVLFSEDEAGSGTVENIHTPNPDAVAIFGDSLLYVNADECTSCTACYQDDVCPVGAIYSEEDVPDGMSNTPYNSTDPNKGHDHSFFIQLTQDVFAD
jgi:ferredoxin